MDKPAIASTIVRLRRERGYKRAVDLADAAGVNLVTLQNIEAGRKKTLDSDMITALCRTLHVSPYEFLPELNRDGDRTEEHAVAVARLQLVNQFLSLNGTDA